MYTLELQESSLVQNLCVHNTGSIALYVCSYLCDYIHLSSSMLSWAHTLAHWAICLGHLFIISLVVYIDPNGVVAMTSDNGLVGTGFTSWYRPQPRAGF